jgi:hypothetical protein
MRDQEAGVDDVEAGLLVPGEDVAGAQFDIGEAGVLDALACELEDRLVAVDAHDAAVRAGDAGQIGGDVAAAAAQVEAAHAGADAGAGQPLHRCRAQDAGEQVQPPFALDAPSDHIFTHAARLSRRGAGPVCVCLPTAVTPSTDRHRVEKGGRPSRWVSASSSANRS